MVNPILYILKNGILAIHTVTRLWDFHVSAKASIVSTTHK